MGMKRLLFALVLVWAWSATAIAKDEPVIIEIANAGAHATAVRVIEHELEALSGGFAVKGPDGKDVPAAYDAKQKKLRFLASVPAGGGKFALHRGAKSSAKMPVWKKGKSDTDKQAVALGKNVKRASGEFENGLLKVSMLREKTLHGRLEIAALKGGYKLLLSPLGASSGCVETAEIGAQVNESYQRGEKVHPEIFNIYPSIATGIAFAEPNPFQRTMTVTCHDWARKNNDKTLQLFDECSFEVTLTWESPVVAIKTTRKLKTTYFNHNGVNLNEIYVDALPIGYGADGAEIKDTNITGTVLTLEFERAMWLRDKTGATVICQPDFKKLGIYKPCVVLAKDRIMTILSQSWHEGWKAIEIKAGDYVDTMTLACNVGEGDKTLKDWTAELLP